MSPAEGVAATADLQRLMDEARKHQAEGRFAEASTAYRAALAIPVPARLAPAMAAAWNNFGTVLHALGETEEAIAAYRRALDLAPGPTNAAYNLATLLLEANRRAEAEAALGEALRRRPDHPDAHNTLGHLLMTSARAAAAVPHFQAAVAGDPDHPTARANLGNALLLAFHRAEGLAELRAAAARNPLHSLTASSLLLALQRDDGTDRTALVAAHRQFGDLWRRAERNRLGFANDPDPERPLRIGYISGGFAAASSERLILPLLAAHDRSRVSLHLYDTEAEESETVAALKAQATQWHRLRGLGDDAVAARIAADGIDVLVDLSGHTSGNRLSALARRLAPVQLTWLGYPDGTGLSAIDGRITDAVVDPSGEEAGAIDPLIRLARPFLCFDPPRHAPVAPPPADAAGAVTFGCFGSALKLTPRIAALWTRLVRSVPGAGLILKAPELADGATANAVREMFTEAGLSPGFVRIERPTKDIREHLEAYRAVDIALDTSPCNGVTTTLEALAMGVPVVSLASDRPAGRIGRSILEAVGLGELAAATEEAFLAAAGALARDTQRRRALRGALRDRLRASPLCDAAGFARAMEEAYRQAWRQWCADRQTEQAPAAMPAADPTEAFNAASALHQAGRLDEAEAAFRAILATHPDHAPSLHMWGMIDYARGRLEEALEKVRQSIALDPGRMTMMANYGTILRALGRLEESVEAYRRAYEIAPGNAELWSNVANVLKEQGRGAEARAAFAEAMRLDPHHASLHSNYLLLLNYDPAETPESLSAAHRAFGRIFDRPAAALANLPDPERRLRVGFVSADFCVHSCAYFALPLMRNLDRRQFELVCYSTGRHNDAATRMFREVADQWRDLAWQPRDALAEAIRADGIDILIDLAGHTRGNGLTVFAARSAPVQVSWLGYPNTTGLASMDYRIVDPWSDPPGPGDALHSERLVRLHRCFLCYGSAADIPPVEPRPDRPVVFGSFNSANKINPGVAALWSRVIHAVPGSRLVLKAAQFTDAGTRARFATMFAAAGLPADRLTMHGWQSGTRRHLERYREIDIALDCFPYAGTTTTCEALFMGVPVVTLTGDRHAARVGVTLLRAAGLSTLIARDADDYVRIATALAADTAALGRLRLELRRRVQTSELCDARGFGAAMGSTLRGLWRQWCADRAARPPGSDAPAIP